MFLIWGIFKRFDFKKPTSSIEHLRMSTNSNKEILPAWLFNINLFDNGSPKPTETAYFSLHTWNVKIWFVIKNNDKLTFHPYYDRYRNLYEAMDIGSFLTYNSEYQVVYPLTELLYKAEKMGLTVEIYIWELSWIDLLLGKLYRRNHDYIYKSNS